MLEQRLINWKSKEKKQIIENSLYKVEIITWTLNEQTASWQCSTSCITWISQKIWLKIPNKHFKELTKLKNPLNKITFKIALKMQLDKIIIQSILLKDEKLSNYIKR
jgi:hypothetical protein